MPIPAASRAFAALALLAVAVRAVRPKDLESEREEIFQQLYRRYFAHYDQGLARSMLGLLPHEIPMQFEFEVPRPLYYMNMTPELLLMRGGINSPSFAPGEAFQSDSPWWLVEIDGLGSKHHQVLQGLPEANSVVVRPKTVLNSSLPDDLVGYLDKLKVPREQHKGSFQFTVGVSAAQVPQLLRRTPPLRRRQVQTAEYCRTRHPPCSQQYEGLLLLAGMVLEQAAACPSCGFPKRCQSPWLLRTHVGDLVQTLPEEERQSLVDDALQLWNGHPDVPLYPKGIMDYLHFPEMAEIGGMVKTRLDDASSAREEMPLEMAGLLQLASRMLREREEVDQRLRGRRCEVNGYGGSWQAPSGRQWLLAAQEGRDLMSDHDSPISKASLSSTVWRSMGKWRHSTEEPRIFLECRAPKTCLGVRSEKWRQLSYQAMLEEAARVAHELETSP